MNTKPNISYEITSFNPLLGTHLTYDDANFKSLTGLRNTVPLPPAPNTQRTLKRFLNIDSSELGLENSEPVKIEIGQINFFINNFLQCPKHIYLLLRKKYGNSTNFSPLFDLNTPMIITELNEEVYNEKKYANIKWRELNQKDIVVDTNFHQIWPKKTGKTPPALTSFFSQKFRGLLYPQR